jgi:hypothetical protein
MKVFEKRINGGFWIRGHSRSIRCHSRSSLSTRMSANNREFARIRTGDLATVPAATFYFLLFTFSRGLRPLLP